MRKCSSKFESKIFNETKVIQFLKLINALALYEYNSHNLRSQVSVYRTIGPLVLVFLCGCSNYMYSSSIFFLKRSSYYKPSPFLWSHLKVLT